MAHIKPLRLVLVALWLALQACALAGAAEAEAPPPSASVWADAIARAISRNDVASGQAIARQIGAARDLSSADGAEVQNLLRFLLDAGDSEGARRLAEALLADRRAAAGGEVLQAALLNAVGEALFEAGDARGALDRFERS